MIPSKEDMVLDDIVTLLEIPDQSWKIIEHVGMKVRLLACQPNGTRSAEDVELDRRGEFWMRSTIRNREIPSVTGTRPPPAIVEEAAARQRRRPPK